MIRREPQLVLFTIFAQLSAGLMVVWSLAAWLSSHPSSFLDAGFLRIVLEVVLAVLVLGVLSASMHLRQPGRAILSLANLQCSWLSREALSGLIFGGLVTFLLLLSWIGIQADALTWFLILASSLAGLGLVWSISRLYMLRTVPVWNHPGTPAAFFTTSLLMGSAGFRVLLVWFNVRGLTSMELPIYIDWAIVGMIALQEAIAFASMASLSTRGEVAVKGLRVVWSELRPFWIVRWSLAFGSIWVLFDPSRDWGTPEIGKFGSTLLVFILLLGSEITGRWIFYGYYQREGF